MKDEKKVSEEVGKSGTNNANNAAEGGIILKRNTFFILKGMINS